MIPQRIFVFGSNLAGRHGAGAALFARRERGAIYGQGIGLQGQSYAIPTKDEHIKTLPLARIRPFIEDFISFARQHPELEFEVTKIGCGLAGYSEDQIAWMFVVALEGVPKNVHLPDGWAR
jgi:hypothetical protein